MMMMMMMMIRRRRRSLSAHTLHLLLSQDSQTPSNAIFILHDVRTRPSNIIEAKFAVPNIDHVTAAKPIRAD